MIGNQADATAAAFGKPSVRLAAATNAPKSDTFRRMRRTVTWKACGGMRGEGAADMGVVQNQRCALYLQVFCEEVERIAHGDDAVVTDADFVWRFRNACAHAQHVLNPSLIAPQLPAYIGVVWSEYEPKLAAYAGNIWHVAVPEAVATRHGAA